VKLPDEYLAIAGQNLKHLSVLSKVTVDQSLSDFLSLDKFSVQASRLQQYLNLTPAMRVLEVGSGYGIALTSMILEFGVDGYGIEPADSKEFPSGATASKILLKANGIDDSRIGLSSGENLSFGDNEFDLVYSFNVLEHTDSPIKVLSESLRVLKPGGILFFEIPNFLSFYEGHYHVLTFPIFSKQLFRLLIRHLYRRDESFLNHLHTEINPLWLKKRLRELQTSFRFDVLSLGESEFRKRFVGDLFFEQSQSRQRLKRVVAFVHRINRTIPLSSIFLVTKTYYPIYLVLRKL
jgi:SAM-dependent methyltransferase